MHCCCLTFVIPGQGKYLLLLLSRDISRQIRIFLVILGYLRKCLDHQRHIQDILYKVVNLDSSPPHWASAFLLLLLSLAAWPLAGPAPCCFTVMPLSSVSATDKSPRRGCPASPEWFNSQATDISCATIHGSRSHCLSCLQSVSKIGNSFRLQDL